MDFKFPLPWPLIILILSLPAHSQIPVERRSVEVDVRGQAPLMMGLNEAPVRSSSKAPADNGRLWELFNEMEVLREENLELRGLIEFQTNQINQLKERQKQHYVDLDSRLRAISSDHSEISAPQRSNKKTDSESEITSTKLGLNQAANDSTQGKTGAVSENKLYQEALDFIKDKNYKGAQDRLKALTSAYPSGFYALYAHYWLGEVILAMPNPDLNQAVKHFQKVVVTDPQHKKAAPSYYKLGTLEDALGSSKKSRATLTKLIEKFPNSGEAKLAKRYLVEMRNR